MRVIETRNAGRTLRTDVFKLPAGREHGSRTKRTHLSHLRTRVKKKLKNNIRSGWDVSELSEPVELGL